MLYRLPCYASTALLVLLTILASCRPGFAAEAEGKHLYALLVLDTDAAGADELGIEVDGRRMVGLLSQSFAVKENGDRSKRLSLTVLTGDDVTKDNIQSYYDGLPKDLSSDTVLFYYSGHGGAVLGEDDGQFLALRSGQVWRKDLSSWIKKHNPRLTLILTDCCSNFDNVASALDAAKGVGKAFENKEAKEAKSRSERKKKKLPPKESVRASNWLDATKRSGVVLGEITPADSPKINWVTARGLFFFNKGSAELTAALPGDFSTGVRKSGGRFSRVLVSRIQKGGLTSWSSLIGEVFDRVQKETGAYYDEKSGLTIINRKGPLGAPNLGLGIETPDYSRVATTTVPFGLGVEFGDTDEYPKNGPSGRITYPGRLIVGNVDEELPIGRAGLTLGDVILGVEGRPVATSADFYTALSGKKQVQIEYARQIADKPERITSKWVKKTTRLTLPEDW
jgi:hypothetical protein